MATARDEQSDRAAHAVADEVNGRDPERGENLLDRVGDARHREVMRLGRIALSEARQIEQDEPVAHGVEEARRLLPDRAARAEPVHEEHSFGAGSDRLDRDLEPADVDPHRGEESRPGQGGQGRQGRRMG